MSHEVAVADAKAYFDTHFGQNTRSNNQAPTEEAPYVVGNLVPDWESGVTMADNERAYTDFAIQKAYRFFLALEDEEGQVCGLELYSRLASVVDFELEGMNQYVATYIPDISFLSCYDYFVEEELLTCEHIDWFTGVVLYTNLWGYHVAAYKYYDGVLVDSSFLNDASKTEEENLADFMRVMKGVALFVAPTSEGTRAIVAEDISGGQIIYYYDESGELVWSYCQIDGIVATRPTLKPISIPGEDIVDVRTIKNDTIAPIVPSGGGGGSGSTSTEKEEPTGEDMAEKIFENYDSLSPEEKEELKNAMQQIIEDCMGKMLTNALKNNKFQPHYTTSYPDNFDIPEELINTSAYIYDQGMIVYRGEGADALLHELFHAYQYLMVNSEEEFDVAKANYEIEAQIARINYYKRTHDITSNNWQEQFYLEGDNQSLLLLSTGVNKNGLLKNGVTDKYLDLYISVATYFENEFDYIFDTSMVLYYDHLRELSKDC